MKKIAVINEEDEDPFNEEKKVGRKIGFMQQKAFELQTAHRAQVSHMRVVLFGGLATTSPC